MYSVFHSMPIDRVRALQSISIVMNLVFTVYAVLYSAGIGMYLSKKAWQITVLHWLANPVIAMWEYSPSTRLEFVLPTAWILLSFFLRGGLINEWTLGIALYQILLGLSYKIISKKRTCKFLIKINMLIIAGFWIGRLPPILDLIEPNHRMDIHLKQGFVHVVTDPHARFYILNELVLHGVIQALLIVSQMCMLEIWRRDQKLEKSCKSVRNSSRNISKEQIAIGPQLELSRKTKRVRGYFSRTTRDVACFFVGWVGCTQAVSPDLMPYPFIPPSPCRAAAVVMATVLLGIR